MPPEHPELPSTQSNASVSHTKQFSPGVPNQFIDKDREHTKQFSHREKEHTDQINDRTHKA
jgi:hypothetical protein